MKKNNKSTKKKILRLLVVFTIFFAGTCSIVAIDNSCKETTGHGGKLVFDVEKAWSFN